MTAESTELLRRFLLALCVWREARGETTRGQQLVAETILNRTCDPRQRWPRTIVGVIVQRYQFSSFNAGDPNAVLFPKEDDAAWPACLAAADIVLDMEHRPLTDANHYHTTNINPVWARADKIVAREGHHVFYKL